MSVDFTRFQANANILRRAATQLDRIADQWHSTHDQNKRITQTLTRIAAVSLDLLATQLPTATETRQRARAHKTGENRSCQAIRPES